VKRLVLAIALAFLVLGADQQGATADSAPANPQQQLALIQQIRAQLSSNLADALAAQQQLRQSLQSNSAQQQVVQGKISDIEAKIADLDDQIAAAQRREAILAQRIDTERAQIRQLARSVYESPDSQLSHLVALQTQQEKSMAQLEQKIAQTRSELSRLNRQSAQLAQAVTDMLQQQQDAIIAAAMQSVWAQLQLWLQTNSVGQIPTSAGHSTKYRFIWPEPNARISQPFGPSTFWFEPAYGSYAHFHTGIDLVEPFGSPVYAADDGVVALVGSSGSGYGNYVVIAHAGGFDTLYGHLSTSLVQPGQRVTQGTAVGLEGSTGNSTGPHLHFELRIAQKPVDPAPYLPPGPPSAFRG